MTVYYLENIFQDDGDHLDFLLELVFSFPQSGDFLYFEHGYYYTEPFKEGVETFIDHTNSLWYRPRDQDEARKMDMDFVINCVVLTRDKEMDSCKFKLSIVEAPESIELKVTEIRQGDFKELLDNRLKIFLEQGVKVLTEEKYNNMIEEQFSRNQWVFKKN